MVETALTRTARALDLVPFIVENPGIAIEDLAKEFDTTPSQIVKDLEMIFMCGLPGYSTFDLIDLTYDDGYVSVIDPQVLNSPRKLTRNEVLSLLLSLESLSSVRHSDDPIVIAIKNLQEKLRAIMQSSLHEIPVINKSQPGSGFLTVFEKAIRSGSGVEITYVSASSDRESVRTVLPEEIFTEHGFIYIKGWCLLTQSSRTFRLDRIKIAGEIALKELPQRGADGIEAVQQIRLFIRNKARFFYEQNSRLCEVISDTEEGIEVRISLRDHDWLLRSLLGFGQEIAVLSPRPLADQLKDMATRALSLYEQHS